MYLDSFDPRPLAGATLLEVWSAGTAGTAPERARAILRAAFPPEVDAQLDALPLGEWNAALLRVRRVQFGDTFTLVDRCPHCAENVELRLPAETLRPAATAAAADAAVREIEVAGCTVHYRLLTGADWRAATEPKPADPRAAGVQLLRRAVLDTLRDGQPIAPDEIPEPAWESLAEALGEADPWSEMLFELRCPRCERTWESLLEPGDYVWHEIAAAAQQSLRQIHRLASAYGWSESDILDLSPERRSAYITLLDEELGWAAESFSSRFAAQSQ